MRKQIEELNFYHIYPFGFCDAPKSNDFNETRINRLGPLYEWMDHMKDLGINALYLGPVFESTSHGYDTADWYHIDRRLGSDEEFRHICKKFRKKGIKLILDGVFHHSGRDFWAFKDLLQNKENSPYKDWFAGVDFSRNSPLNDPFDYTPWEGHYNLVKLNLKNRDLKNHLFGAVKSWIEDFGIEGLRLDVAYLLDMEFLRELSAFTRSINENFFIMGEVIHGDYNRWSEVIDSITNYECFKGIYSAQNDSNLFEISYALNRQFGEGGIYTNFPLYNFLDNHNVNRISSLLFNKAHPYTSYILLYTIPGIPSIYYGSEWGIKGERSSTEDYALRPGVKEIQNNSKENNLPGIIKKLSEIRKKNSPLQKGKLEILHTDHKQLAFSRTTEQEEILILINISDKNETIEIPKEGVYEDLLNQGDHIKSNGNKLTIPLYPCWGRILRRC